MKATTKALNHLSILASAGAGKTYALSNRYLSLAAQGAPVGSILASTFTRLAAGEIRDRVLMRLVEAAEDREKREELAGAIGAVNLERVEVMALLGSIARSPHRTRIQTLDSFFGSIVHTFGLELGIAPGVEVMEEEEAEALRQEAMRLVLYERDPQRLVNLLRALTQGTSQRSVMRVIDETVRGLYEVYREAEEGAWDHPAARRELKPVELLEAIARLEEARPEEPKSHVTAHGKDCAQARGHEWEAFLGKGLAWAIASGDRVYYKAEIDGDVVAAYEPVIAHARAVLSNRIRRQTVATRDLLGLFDARYREVKRRAGVMTFSDITAAMGAAQQCGSFEEICFRIDASIRHLLLDEFQDTSLAQWRVLEPVARELVAHAPPARTFFCVGDVKQSIYGWRGANPEILEGIPELLRGPGGTPAVAMEPLAKSYRSSPAVIETVNAVFGSLGGNAALEGYDEAVERFGRGFARHTTAKTELGGYAELRTAPRAEEGEDQAVVRLVKAAEVVAGLYRCRPGMRIGVLTRTNNAVARLLYELGPSRLDVAASGRGGGPLTDAPAVNAVLDLLRLADHPDDTVSAFNVARGPLGVVVGLEDEQSRGARIETAWRVRQSLMRRGYAATIAGWVERMAAACDGRQYRRLMQLIELAGEYDGGATLRPGDFVAVVERRRVTAASGGEGGIEVMTIHQAKGLDFDAVVLADLEGKLTGPRPPAVACGRGGTTGPITRICRWVKETRELIPELKGLFEREESRVVREHLSLLYVAMTRAKRGLYMLIDPPKMLRSGKVSTTIGKTLSGVVRWALAEGKVAEADTILYGHGDRDWMERKKHEGERREEGMKMEETAKIELRSGSGPANRGEAAEPASSGIEAGVTLRQRLELGDEEAAARGTAMHKLLEQVEWLEDWEADAAGLVQVVQRALPRRGQAWVRRQVEAFEGILGKEEVKRSLMRGETCGGGRRVYREQPFVRLAEGRVQRGFIDRLVVELDEGGRARGATVIDFKTDEVGVRDAAARAQGYRGQLETYRSAAARLLSLPESAVGMSAVFVGPGVTVELG